MSCKKMTLRYLVTCLIGLLFCITSYAMDMEVTSYRVKNPVSVEQLNRLSDELWVREKLHDYVEELCNFTSSAYNIPSDLDAIYMDYNKATTENIGHSMVDMIKDAIKNTSKQESDSEQEYSEEEKELSDLLNTIKAFVEREDTNAKKERTEEEIEEQKVKNLMVKVNIENSKKNLEGLTELIKQIVRSSYQSEARMVPQNRKALYQPIIELLEVEARDNEFMSDWDHTNGKIYKFAKILYTLQGNIIWQIFEIYKSDPKLIKPLEGTGFLYILATLDDVNSKAGYCHAGKIRDMLKILRQEQKEND